MPTLLKIASLTVALILAAGAIAAGQAPGPTEILRQGPATVTVLEMSSVYHGQGRTTRMRWEASDPRLSGTVETVTDWSLLRDSSAAESETFELVNDDGRWVGQPFGLNVPVGPEDGSLVIGLPIESPDSQSFIDTDTVLLRGEGGYEGLVAFTSIDWRQDPPVVDAVVFVGGPIADLPDLHR